MLASCGGDRTVRIWKRAAGGCGGQPQAAQQHAQPAAAGEERWVCSAILEDTHSRTIRSACWSPDGRFLATASFDRTTAIWQHQVWHVLGGHWLAAAVAATMLQPVTAGDDLHQPAPCLPTSHHLHHRAGCGRTLRCWRGTRAR